MDINGELERKKGTITNLKTWRGIIKVCTYPAPPTDCWNNNAINNTSPKEYTLGNIITKHFLLYCYFLMVSL